MALLQYNVAKSSNGDGHIIFVLTEVYETTAGIEYHSKQWHEAAISDDFTKFISRCKPGQKFFYPFSSVLEIFHNQAEL